MRLLRAAVPVTLAVVVAVPSAACTSDDPKQPDGRQVVASNTWVGALAKAAGATDVAVIAPANIPDQGAFQPTADELAVAADAEHVLYAESDDFADALVAAAGDANTVVVEPANTLPAIRADVTRLARELGTEADAARWLAGFEADVESMLGHSAGLAPIPPIPVVAHTDVAGWADIAAVKLVGTYGPDRPDGGQLAELAAQEPKLLLASVHAPDSTPDLPGVHRVDLMNYPGEDLDLYAVFEANMTRIGAWYAKPL